MADFQYVPAPGRLIVEPIERPAVSEGGIHLPDATKEKPQLGKVVAYTPGERAYEHAQRSAPTELDDERGKQGLPRIVGLCKVGDTIFHSKYGGAEIEVDKKALLLLREDDILAVQVAAAS